MSKIDWTDQQLDAINIDGGGNILVSAAAGSGKTAVLVERIVQKIANVRSNISISDLLVVTFSNAAAEEIKQRVHNRLDSILHKDPSNIHIYKQKLDLSNASICTMHSFCLSILREDFNIIGLSPGFRVADSLEIRQLKQSCYSNIIENYYNISDNHFDDLVNNVCGSNSSDLENLIISLYDFLMSIPHPMDYVNKVIQMYYTNGNISETVWGNYILDKLPILLSDARNLIENAVNLIQDDADMVKAYMSMLMSDRELIETVFNLVNNRDYSSIFKLLFNYTFVRFPVVKNTDQEKKEMIKEIRDNVKDIFRDILKDFVICDNNHFIQDIKYTSSIIKLLFNIVIDFYNNYKLEKQHKNIVDFNDLEQYTIDILLKKQDGKLIPTDACIKLSEKYNEVMIDEYQDTNQIQELIFKSISLSKNNMYMVGDSKQSIYKFRQAMPEIFIRKKNNFIIYNNNNKQFPAKILLDKNFRSNILITDFINYIFKNVMHSEIADISYDNTEMLYAQREKLVNKSYQPELHILNLDSIQHSNKKEVEPLYIAQTIRRLIDDGFKVKCKDSFRPCNASDFCILLRSVDKKSQDYINYLNSHNIEVDCDMSYDYLKTKEINLIISMLKIINNPLDDISMLTVLMSPIFNFSPDDVAQIRLADKSISIYKSLINNYEDYSKVSKFLDLVNKLIQQSSCLSIANLVQQIYDILDFEAIFGIMEGGSNRIDNLRAFKYFIKDYENANSCVLSEFIRFINNSNNNVGLKLLGKTNCAKNGVKIMSIHRSKGLEFPICILADCGKKFNFVDTHLNYMVDLNLGFTINIKNKEELRSYDTIACKALKISKKTQIFAEELRILYVALTRAQDKLIITMSDSDEKLAKLFQKIYINSNWTKGINHYFLSKLNCYKDILICSLFNHVCMAKLKNKYNVYNTGSTDISPEIQVLLINEILPSKCTDNLNVIYKANPDHKIIKEIINNINFNYNSSAKNIPIKLSVTDLAKQSNKDKIKLESRPRFMINNGVTSAEKGSILHSFMQFVDFKNAIINLDEEISRLVTYDFLSQSQADTLNIGKIQKFLKSDLIKKIIKSSNVLREFKFRYRCNDIDINYCGLDKSLSGIIVQGIVDCIIINDHSVTIIDYKTDFTNSLNELSRIYNNQLYLYKQAIQQVFELPIKECIIYSLHLSKQISLVF